MQIIALEGIDSAGKETQIQNLEEYLKQLGNDVVTQSFPRYDTPIGILIKQALQGKVKLNREALHALMDVDKIDFNRDLYVYEYIYKVDFLILDRFTLSNYIYMKARNMKNLEGFIELQKYTVQPDLTIIIDIPVEESFKRRPNRQDLFENSKNILTLARQEYLKVAQTDASVFAINGVGSVKEVSNGIIELVNLFFNI
jgi:dTMP kinase